MRKKLILFLMLALFGSTSFLRADVVEIGDGTGTTYYGPYNSLWGYSFVEQIYTADEIGMAGTINSIAFELRDTDAAATCDIVVYMKNVSKSAFAGADDYENVTPADVVFDGSFTFQPGWSTIILDTPFAYDGTSNLLIGIDENTSGYSTRYFYYTAVTGGLFSAHSDSQNPDPTNLASFTGTKYTQNYRNNIQIDITAGGGGGGTSGELTVHDGTGTNSYVPIYGFYADAYLKCEMVYPAAELAAMNGSTINSMKFYPSSPATDAWTSTWQVFVSEVTDATISDFAGPGTVVYEGPLDGTQSEMEITFTTPYQYNGGNLLVGVYNIATGNYKSVSWAGEAVTGASVQGYDYGSLSDVTASQRNFLPKTTFAYTTAGGGGSNWDPDQTIPVAEVILTAPEYNAQNVASPATLKWENDDNAFEYKVEFGTTYGQIATLIDWDTVQAKQGSVQVELEPNTRYFWRVYNRNEATPEGIVSELGMFTSEFNSPTNVKVVPDEIFTDGSTIVKWNIVGGAIAELPETHVGEGGSGSSPYLPTYNLYNYSLTEQIFTVEEIGNAGIINSITFLPAGEITRNLQIYMVNTDKASFTGDTDWVAVTADDLVYSGNVAMAAPQTTVTLNDPFVFSGENLLLVVNDITGTWTSSIQYSTFDATAQAINIYEDGATYNPLAPSGTGTVRNFKNQIIINAGAKNRDLVGCNVYVDSVKMNDEPITERQYVLTAEHMAELGVVAYNMEGHNVTVTGMYDYGESNHSAPAILYVSGYQTISGTVKELMSDEPMAGVTVKLAGKDEFNNTVSFQTTTIANGSYEMEVKCGNYTLTATYDGFEPAVVEGVTVTHMDPVQVDILYMHENYAPVYKVYAEEGDLLGAPVADVIWSFNNFTSPNPGGGTGGGGNGSTFSEGFESGMPADWTVVDGNNDGWTWCLTSAIPSTWTYYAGMTLDWYRTGSNAICSGSYINGVGAITPDEYLVTPQVTLGAGSTFSFWAAATDASYPADHFGVFVSDDASNWTMVNEWTLTGKSGGNDGGRASRDGKGAKLGTWHNYTVDLSSYAGQKYIAIRHFNCNDQYIMCVDDIELSNGSKVDFHADDCGYHNYNNSNARNMWDLLATFPAAEGGQYGVVTDGEYIYTSNWGYSSAAHNFYKYDMEGNVIEGFEISGCGTLRGMTFDGEYFYGVANSSTVYCVDFNNHTLVGTFTSAYGAMRCISYDPERDGFWVVGNWSGNLTLIDRTGAVQFAGPAPSSASDVAYFKDAEGVEHVYCFNNSDNGVYDYNVTTNTLGGQVFNISSIPGYDAGSSGGCHVGNYGDKVAFYGDVQQSPNLIGIYELGEAQNVGPSVNGGSQMEATEHYFEIYRKPVLLENMPEDPETLVEKIAETDHENGFADTVYTDINYNELEAGVYEYGVQAVYPWTQRSDNNATGIVWSNDLSHNMTTTLTINGTCALGLDQIVGAVVNLVNNDEDYEFNAELDEEGAWSTEEFRKGHYTMTVNLPGYLAQVGDGADLITVPAEGLEMNLWLDEPVINLTFVEDLAPATGFVVSSTGLARWNDMLNNNRAAQRYHVMCDEIFQGETTNNYMFLNTEDLVPGETYTAAVAVIYETGMSDFVTADFTYMECSSVETQVDSLEATVDLSDVTLTWAGGSGTGPTPPTPPGGGSTFTEGFESGLPADWNVVDANNDGWTWCLTSAIPTTWTYYASMTLDWYRTGTNAICSGSYINGVGALTPDEYLVTNQVTLGAGSTFSFWAAATDAGYPADHFGVFVSDDASNWTMVNEWTLTGKSGGNDGGRASRDGKGAKLGTWHNYNVDLSSYAGQKYIAIRHFNCNDQYIMCVDDIELSAGSKSGNGFSAAGQGFGPANFDFTDDGNWYYYDNGSNEDAIGTGGGNFWWGIMLPAGFYEGTSLTKVAAYDYMAMTGNASIYQGGATAPAGSALATVDVTFTGSEDFVEFTFAEPVTLDPTQNVWVVFYNGSGATYPAAVCNNTGNANGRWVSLDGSTWEDLAGYGLDYTFMIRAYIETGSAPGPGPVNTSLTPNAFNIFEDGEFIGATTDNTFTWVEDDEEEHEYCVIYIDANYNASCPVCILVAAEGVGEHEVVNAIYPNPTNGNLYINTNAEMKGISIVNMLGQVVYNKIVNGTETMIDMAQFGNGIYVVNVVTENGTSVNRIIVNK